LIETDSGYHNDLIIDQFTKQAIPFTQNAYNGCLNQSTGVIKWNKQILKPVMASPAKIKDKVFFATSDKRILFSCRRWLKNIAIRNRRVSIG
jgi:hypothetical protein